MMYVSKYYQIEVLSIFRIGACSKYDYMKSIYRRCSLYCILFVIIYFQQVWLKLFECSHISSDRDVPAGVNSRPTLREKVHFRLVWCVFVLVLSHVEM